MLFTFLLVVHAIIAALLVTVILMQKSEGGGLTSGGGGSPGGLMSARGAADFMTRATAVLATLFIVMAIILAVLAANQHSDKIDTSAAKAPVTAPPVSQPTTAPPASDNPLADAARRTDNSSDGVPLAQ